MSEKQKLKRCPFCGGEAEIESKKHPTLDCYIYRAICAEAHKCDTNSGWCATKKLARRIWNTRPIEDKLLAFVKRVASNESLFQTIDSDGEEVMGLNSMLYYEARALLRGESGEEGK